MFCERCKKENDNKAKFCQSCGAPLAEKTIEVDDEKDNTTKIVNDISKNAIFLGIIAILFGSLGVHNFIMGYTKKGLTQLLLTVIGWIAFFGPIVSAIWSIVDAIMLFTGAITEDAKGNTLKR